MVVRGPDFMTVKLEAVSLFHDLASYVSALLLVFDIYLVPALFHVHYEDHVLFLLSYLDRIFQYLEIRSKVV